MPDAEVQFVLRRRSHPPGRFGFRHLLTRDAAYAALLETNRRALHAATAEELAARLKHGEVDELSRLAAIQRHWQEAERWREAHFACCLRLLRRANLGQLEGWEEVAQSAQQHWQRARLTDPTLPTSSAAFCNAMALYCALTSQTDEAGRWAKRAVQLAQASNDRAQEALAYNHCGIARHYSGDPDEGLRYYRLALELFTELGNPVGQMQACNNLGLSLQESGRREEGQPWLERGLQLAREHKNLLMEANLALNLGIGLSQANPIESSRPYLERAYELALELGDVSTESFAIGYLGNLTEARGELDAAYRQFSTARRLTDQMKQPRLSVWWIAAQAECRIRQGRVADAATLAIEALDLARRCEDRYILSHAIFCRAEVALLRGEFELAHELMEELEENPTGTALHEDLQTHPRYKAVKQRLQELALSSPAPA